MIRKIVLKAIIYDLEDVLQNAKEVLPEKDEKDRAYKAAYFKGICDAEIVIKDYLYKK